MFISRSLKFMARWRGTLMQTKIELFLILKGNLRIEMETGTVALNEGEMFVVPKGVRHNPVAEQECHIMLIERKSTLHTGDVITEKTRPLSDQLRPLMNIFSLEDEKALRATDGEDGKMPPPSKL